uniref:Putative secreted protein n=1 Tax=Ixodes ricinus TaxID=34613 RepID=A0A6B0UWE4_IXORI
MRCLCTSKCSLCLLSLFFSFSSLSSFIRTKQLCHLLLPGCSAAHTVRPSPPPLPCLCRGLSSVFVWRRGRGVLLRHCFRACCIARFCGCGGALVDDGVHSTSHLGLKTVVHTPNSCEFVLEFDGAAGTARCLIHFLGVLFTLQKCLEAVVTL